MINGDVARVTWKKSTRSNGSGDCVETAVLASGDVAVRDSKNRDGAVLTFAPTAWTAFLTEAQQGKFDLR